MRHKSVDLRYIIGILIIASLWAVYVAKCEKQPTRWVNAPPG